MTDKFLNDTYQKYLGRVPEDEGFEFWKGKLESNEMTKEEVEQAIANSPEAIAKAEQEFADFKLSFKFSVSEINAILAVLGNAPFTQVANIVADIRSQGEPQFKALLEAKANKEA